MLALALVAAALTPLGPPPSAVAKVRLQPRPHALRVYLAPARASIRGRLDSRLHFVGILPRRHRELVFHVPPLDTGRYRVWCSGCRKRIFVRVTTTGDPCSVTHGVTQWGNGLLTTRVPPDGTVVIPPDRVTADGLFWTKLVWRLKPWSAFGQLSVVAERLDASEPRRRMTTAEGESGPSWAARMYFPSEGCYRVTGRVEDVELAFVVRVVLG